MDIINVVTARSVWLFDLAEMNPQGKKLRPGLLTWLQNKYGFERIPSSTIDVDETKALVFSRGVFKNKEVVEIQIELKAYEDGLIANSISSTRDTDAFLEDVLQSSSKDYELIYRPEMIRRKLYISEVNFRSDKYLSNLNRKLSEFAAKISALIPGDPKPPFELGGLHFWPSQTVPDYKILRFIIERKLNTLPSENKYFSSAPLPTDDHINMLNEFEEILRRG